MENLNAEQIKYCLELILKSGIGMSRDDVDVTDIKRALALINSQEQDKEKLGLLISEIEKEKQKLFDENKRLTEENERLQKALNTDISFVRVCRGSGKTAYLREIGRIKVDAIRADTVRKMQEQAVKSFNFGDDIMYSQKLVLEVIDQIAKEMLEDGI